MADSWVLEELAAKIETAEQTVKRFPTSQAQQRPPYADFLSGALDEALRILGRSGSDVIDTILSERYGLQREDIALKPGVYMSAMKDLLDSGCKALENVMLSEIRRTTGVNARSIEDAAFRLKKIYEGQPGSATSAGY